MTASMACSIEMQASAAILLHDARDGDVIRKPLQSIAE